MQNILHINKQNMIKIGTNILASLLERSYTNRGWPESTGKRTD